jgi:hypothetical protein
MSAFKDQMAADLAEFLNADEFAEAHRINEKSGVLCIFDTKNEPAKSGFSRYEGYGKSTATLFIRESDLPGSVLNKKIVTVDGAKYTIVNSTLDCGLYELALEAIQ